MLITKHIVFNKLISQPLKFDFISDLHNYPNGPVYEAIKTINPDVVLVGGDFIQSQTDTESGLAFLNYVAARWPTYCSSGKEHDFDEELVETIRDTGAIFLRNQADLFNGVNIGGLNTIPLMGQPRDEKNRLISINRAWLETYSVSVNSPSGLSV